MGAPQVGGLGPQAQYDYASRLTYANNAVVAGLAVMHTWLVPDAATGDIDIIVGDKVEVVDVIVRKDGAGAGNTYQVKNGATAISDAIAGAVDKTITRAGTIDTAQNVIAAGGTLRLTATRAAGVRNALVTAVCLIRP